MKRDVYDNKVTKAIEEIHRMMNPVRSKWVHIGYRQGRRVFMTESNLRRCDIADICSDPLLQPVQNRQRSGCRPNRNAPASGSMWFELLCWLGQSVLEIFAGQRN